LGDKVDLNLSVLEEADKIALEKNQTDEDGIPSILKH